MLQGMMKGIKKQSVRSALLLCLFFAVLSVSVLSLAGCKAAQREEAGAKADGRLHVVTTLFPYYDFLRQIAGDRIRLTLVVPAGMDSHSFEPTPADMITIQNADILVCNGGAMEQWVERVVDSFGEGAAPGRVVTMMDYVDVVLEEYVEGMEHSHAHGHDEVVCEIPGHDHDDDEAACEIAEHDHDHDEAACEIAEHAHDHDEAMCEIPEHDHDHNYELEYVADSHGHVAEYDEHIWTSPVNAMELTRVLEQVLSEEDPKGQETYHSNADAFIEELEALDREFREIVAGGRRKLVVFGDKFPLRYFFDEYGLTYRAAFSGCSTDTEPSAKTIAYLIDRVREEEIPAVYYLELSSARVAEIIGEETGAEPLLFHTCHNLTRRQFESGVTYLELMQGNADRLRRGLE